MALVEPPGVHHQAVHLDRAPGAGHLGELHAGFRLGNRGAQNERELSSFLRSPRVSIVDVGDQTAVRYAEIVLFLRRAGRPIPTNDIWIAAGAMEHGLRIVTTDAHFTRLPQVIVDFRPV